MNALSRVVSDLTQKKNSRKLKYETTTWNGDDVNPMAFCSPLHDPSYQSSTVVKAEPLPQKSASVDAAIMPPPLPKVERGSVELSELQYNMKFLKRPNPPHKRVAAAIREKFTTDFLRSKSLQKLNNKDDDQDITFSNEFEDCKQTSSLAKIKKQARIIDVHVSQFNGSKRNNDNKTLLKHDQMDSD